MLRDIYESARAWYRGLPFLARIGLKALVATTVVALLVAAFPRLAAAAVGGMLAALGATLLRWAWAE
jgi:hypothetical protein